MQPSRLLMKPIRRSVVSTQKTVQRRKVDIWGDASAPSCRCSHIVLSITAWRAVWAVALGIRKHPAASRLPGGCCCGPPSPPESLQLFAQGLWKVPDAARLLADVLTQQLRSSLGAGCRCGSHTGCLRPPWLHAAVCDVCLKPGWAREVWGGTCCTFQHFEV